MPKTRLKNDVLFTRRKNIVQMDNNQIRQQRESYNFINTNSEEILEIVDCDDLDETTDSNDKQKDLDRLTNKLSRWNRLDSNHKIRSIEYSTAIRLKTLLIGNATNLIGSQWSEQYFEFEFSSPKLWYGLIQHKGGPCGVLASLQAFLCVQFFHLNQVSRKLRSSNLSEYRRQCLSRAVSSILWQIGGNRQMAVLAFEVKETFLEGIAEFQPDGITEHLAISEFFSEQEMFEFILNLFENNLLGIGCVSLLYSCILSRGVEEISQDYDSGSIKSLLCTNGLLCTQELVNLMLIGRAVSNVFDRNVRYNEMILRGITHQSAIGFLTLHEFYQDFNVGSCYKNPKYPVFVVLSEAHFTVLFQIDSLVIKSNEGKQSFDLYYYDGLLRQENEIRLTIKLSDGIEYENKLSGKGNSRHTISNVPIECVIKTKWPNAKIDWNDSEKIF